MRGGVADNEFGEHDDDRIGDCGEDGGGGRANEDSNEGLSHGEIERGAGLDENKPNRVDSHEDEVDRKEAGAGSVSKEDTAHADNKIDETGADIEPPVAVVNGENAPL